MATEGQSRKTRRTSRGQPLDPHATTHARPPRPPHSQPQDAQYTRREPHSRVPSPLAGGNVSPMVDASSRLRKDSLLVAQQHNSPSPRMSPNAQPSNRSLQSVAVLDSQEHVSLSDGDMPPIQGLKFRKGHKSPAKSSADDKKGRRASNVDSRSTSSVTTRDGLGLTLRHDHLRDPTPRPRLDRSPGADVQMREQHRDSPPIESTRRSASRSRPQSPAQLQDALDSDEEPFAFDSRPTQSPAIMLHHQAPRSSSRSATPGSFRSNNSGQRESSPLATASPALYQDAYIPDRHDFSTQDPRRRAERALADVANEMAKSPSLSSADPPKSSRRVPVPSENAEPPRPSTNSTASASSGVKPSDSARVSNSKSVQTKSIGLGLPSAPVDSKPSKLLQPASRPLRSKSDPKGSPRDSYFGIAAQRLKPENDATSAAAQMPTQSLRQRTQTLPASPLPSRSSAASPAPAATPAARDDEAKPSAAASRSLTGLRISSLAAKFTSGRKGTASPTSPVSPELSPAVGSLPAASPRIPSVRGRGPSGLSSPHIKQDATSPSINASPNLQSSREQRQSHDPAEHSGRQPRSAQPTVDVDGPQMVANRSPEAMSTALEPTARPSAMGRSTPEPRKNSQDQRMHALMDGLGLVLGDLGSAGSRPQSRAEEREAERKPSEQREQKRQSRTVPLEDRDSVKERREQREVKRQSSSSALRRTPEHTPVVDQGTPSKARPASRASNGHGTPRTERDYRRPGSRLGRFFDDAPPEPEPASMTLDTPDDEDDEDDDTGIWTPVDERFNADYLPSHQIRDEDVLPGSEDRHDQLGKSIQVALADEMHVLSKSSHAPAALPSESDISSLGSMNEKAWSAVSTTSELSTGAEALFKNLQSPEDASSAQTPSTPAHARSPMLGEQTPTRERASTLDDTWSEFTTDGNIRYVESEADDEESAPDLHHRRRTWRSTIAPAAFDSLLERHGAQEMQRQELIWEICESEQAFVRDMRNVLRIFVQPLRTQDRRWIPGVPSAVTRLFDWLDDIVQLHSQLFSALHAARSKQYPIVTYIAEALRPFVPRLELHQPFLVRLDSASRAIDDLVDDATNDFGEFVRMQTRVPEWSGKTLTSALRQPTVHLTGYPSNFQKLWQCTPRTHADHLATFSLYHSTDMIVRVMLEVCSREDEYERIKDLSSRISGLPHHFTLARRERRLVAQGLLRRVHLSEQERAILEGDEAVVDDTPDVPLCMPILSPQYHNMRSWGSPSLSTTSWQTSSPASSPASSSPWQGSRPLSMMSSASFSSSFTSDVEDDLVRFKAPRSVSSLSSRGHKAKPQDSLVYVFVFTDLVLLTHRTEARDEFEKDSWHLVDDNGMARVLGISDLSGKLDYDQLLSLDVLPMPQEHEGVNVVPKDSTACPVYLSLSERATARSGTTRLLEEAKQQWMQAFHKCFMFTLRSLSFPCHTGMDLAHGPTADYEMDTKMSVMTILSSGLPLPKSPSQLLDGQGRGRLSDAVEEEREERGWWAVRFRQVLREMQRQDLPLAFEDHGSEGALPSTRRTRSTTGPTIDHRRRSVMASRPLLLSATSSSIMLTPATPRKEKGSASPIPSGARRI